MQVQEQELCHPLLLPWLMPVHAGAAPPFVPPLVDAGAGAGAGAAPPFAPPLVDAGAGAGAAPPFVPPLVDAGAGAAPHFVPDYMFQ